MRLLLLITDLEFGGTPTVVRELAIALKDNVHLEVACLSKAGPVADQIRAAGIVVTPLNARGAGDISVIPRLIKLIRHKSFDTVFSFLIHANTVAAMAQVVCKNVRFIQSIQTTQRSPRWHWFVQGLVQHACQRVIVPSASVARVAQDWSHVPPEKIAVISNAVHVEEFTPRDATNPIRRIGFIGRLDPIKRVGDLVRAMTFLNPHMQLDIFGAGPEKQSLQNQIRDLNLQSRITLHGPIARPQQALEKIDLLVLPSAAEGFGLVLIEAMAAGIPVIGTNVPGIQDVIKDGKTGLLVPPNDPHAIAKGIEKIASDDQLRKSLIEAGHQAASENFSWNAVLPAYREELGIMDLKSEI